MWNYYLSRWFLGSEFLTKGGLAITGGVREYKGIRGAFDFDTDIEIEAVLQFAIVLDWTQINE